MPWIALACSVLLTVLAWDVSARSLAGRLRDQFSLRTDEIASAITRRMLEHEVLLRGGAGLFRASHDVTREEFRTYLDDLELERTHPGIQGVGFAKRATPDQLASLTGSVRAEGYPGFTVHPSGARADYFPIVFLEPFEGRNLRAFGYDMFSEPVRRAAMERAWYTGQPSVTGIVTLVQETTEDIQKGLLLYMPVYRAEAITREERQSRLIGFVYSPFRAKDLMRGILGSSPDDIDFAVYDEASSESFFDTRGPRWKLSELARKVTLTTGGRSWTLRFWSRPSFGKWIARYEPLAVLCAGVVINLLLFYILGASASVQRRAQALAQEMTDRLMLSHAREQSQMLASLREKETLLREIHHRVKNNLQVVSSMLSLQRNHLLDPAAMEPLQQSQQRVLAMAALHEFLYQSKDLSRVDTKAYLSHLVALLGEAYQMRGRVALDLALDDVPLDMDHAIPCGLITNELVSNAFKYAFANGRAGSLHVALERKDSQLTLIVADDGPGLPPELDLEMPSTLGLQLVSLLTEQLRGTLRVERTPGARFTVTFPVASSLPESA